VTGQSTNALNPEQTRAAASLVTTGSVALDFGVLAGASRTRQVSLQN
jgi:hypothetical protein